MANSGVEDQDPWGKVDEPFFDQDLHDLLMRAAAAANREMRATYPDYCVWLTKLRDTILAPNGENLRVLYPGSRAHTDVGDILGRDNVLHVDPDDEAMDVMASNGYRTVTATVRQYLTQHPQAQFDCIISKSSDESGLPIEVLDHLKPEGYVVANNWHNAASFLASEGSMRLVGAVLPYTGADNASFIQGEPAYTSLSSDDVMIRQDAMYLFQKQGEQ